MRALLTSDADLEGLMIEAPMVRAAHALGRPVPLIGSPGRRHDIALAPATTVYIAVSIANDRTTASILTQQRPAPRA